MIWRNEHGNSLVFGNNYANSLWIIIDMWDYYVVKKSIRDYI